MPRYQFLKTDLLKSLSVVIVGGFIGYSSMKIINRPAEGNRQLASVTYSKMASEQFAKNLFQVEVVPEKIATDAKEASTIKIKIKALKAFPAGLQYTWSLPENAKVVSGKVSDDLGDFAADQVKEFQIETTNFSKAEKTYLSFEIKGVLDGKKVSRDILASSRPEDSFEYVVQKMEQQRQQASENHSGEPMKNNKKLKSAIDPKNVQF